MVVNDPGTGMLAGRVCLLAGVGPRIGAAVARVAVREGASVALLARSSRITAPLAEEIRTSGGRAVAFECDLVDDEQLSAAVAATVEQLGSIDAVFYNAARSSRHDPEGGLAVDDALLASMRLNVGAAMTLAGLTISTMRDRSRGAFVFTSSSSASVGEEAAVDYGVFKAGLNALARSLASRYGRYGIRANAVVPLVVSGPMAAPIAALTCLGRSGTAEEVGEVVCFLLSDRASAITGQVVYADAGLMAKAHWPSAYAADAPMATAYAHWDDVVGIVGADRGQRPVV